MKLPALSIILSLSLPLFMACQSGTKKVEEAPIDEDIYDSRRMVALIVQKLEQDGESFPETPLRLGVGTIRNKSGRYIDLKSLQGHLERALYRSKTIQYASQRPPLSAPRRNALSRWEPPEFLLEGRIENVAGERDWFEFRFRIHEYVGDRDLWTFVRLYKIR